MIGARRRGGVTANPHAGEVLVVLDGQPHCARLTLGALAGLEVDLGAASMIEMIERFEAGGFTTRDVLAVLVAGLRGGGWEGEAEDLLTAEIAGGPLAAARMAAELIARAFRVAPA